MPLRTRIVLTIPRSNLNRFAKPLVDVVNKYTQRAERELKVPTATWKESSKPEFRREFRIIKRADTLVGNVRTSSRPYLWVSGGTKGGKFILSSDWSPKTVVGSLKPRKGSGTVIGGRGVRRNTEARNFDLLVVAKLQKGFEKEAQKALDLAAKRAFPGATKGGKHGVTIIT